MFMVFFFNDTATTEIYTLSLHDALPILQFSSGGGGGGVCVYVLDSYEASGADVRLAGSEADRKSTRLNSSHMSESRMPSSA